MHFSKSKTLFECEMGHQPKDYVNDIIEFF